MASSKVRDKIYSNRNSLVDSVNNNIHYNKNIIGHKIMTYEYSSGKVFNCILGYTIPNYKFKDILNKILTRGFYNL